MIRCVICYQKFTESISFKTLLKPKIYCEECESKFLIVEESCEYCSHPIGYNCCNKTLINKSVFIENKHLKDIIFQIKVYNLYEKIFVFEEIFFKSSLEYSNYIAVPIPLSSMMMNKRGFNQSYILASFTKLSIANCVERIDNITQSKKTYIERITNPPKFKLKYLPRNKNILLIDDIYTTGTTLKEVSKLFPDNYNIRCLTLQRTTLN